MLTCGLWNSDVNPPQTQNGHAGFPCRKPSCRLPRLCLHPQSPVPGTKPRLTWGTNGGSNNRKRLQVPGDSDTADAPPCVSRLPPSSRSATSWSPIWWHVELWSPVCEAQGSAWKGKRCSECTSTRRQSMAPRARNWEPWVIGGESWEAGGSAW